MDQLVYAPLSHTHYWHEVGMLYLFTMHLQGHFVFICFAPLHVYPCPCMGEYQQNTCTAVNMHSGKMDALASGSGKFNVQHAPKSLCCCFTVVIQGRGLTRSCTKNIVIEKNESHP